MMIILLNEIDNTIVKYLNTLFIVYLVAMPLKNVLSHISFYSMRFSIISNKQYSVRIFVMCNGKNNAAGLRGGGIHAEC